MSCTSSKDFVPFLSTASVPTNIIIIKGDITIPSDFPTLSSVQTGWFYSIRANVIDNDASKTNTGQSFIDGQDIVWTGLAWEVVGGGDSPTFVQSFLITDWVGPSAGYYTILFTHNLNLSRLEVEVWDSSNSPVDVERLLTSNNSMTLRVPYSPDLRFSGSIWIKSI